MIIKHKLYLVVILFNLAMVKQHGLTHRNYEKKTTHLKLLQLQGAEQGEHTGRIR